MKIAALGIAWVLLVSACGGAVGNAASKDGGTGGTALTTTAGGNSTTGVDEPVGGMGGTATTEPVGCPPSVSVRGMAQGATQVVAVGEATDADCTKSGVVWRSADGRNWTRVLDHLPALVSDVAYGNGRFLATSLHADGSTGVSAPARLYVSDDGVVWSQQDLGDGDYARQIAFGNGYFLIAESNTGGILRSKDTSTWQRFERSRTEARAGVEFAAGVFAIYASSSDIVEITSDAESFTNVDATGSGATGVGRQWIGEITAVNDRFVADTWFNCCFGEAGGPWYGYAESANGVAWTQKPETVKIAYPKPLIVTSTWCVARANGRLESGASCDSTQDRKISDFYPQVALSTSSLFIVGGTSGIVVSQDGSSWEQVLSGAE